MLSAEFISIVIAFPHLPPLLLVRAVRLRLLPIQHRGAPALPRSLLRLTAWPRRGGRVLLGAPLLLLLLPQPTEEAYTLVSPWRIQWASKRVEPLPQNQSNQTEERESMPRMKRVQLGRIGSTRRANHQRLRLKRRALYVMPKAQHLMTTRPGRVNTWFFLPPRI